MELQLRCLGPSGIDGESDEEESSDEPVEEPEPPEGFKVVDYFKP